MLPPRWDGLLRWRSKGRVERAPSLRPDVRRLDDRPPAFALGLLQIAQGFGRLLIDRRDLNAEFRKTLPHQRIEQHLRHGSVELGDDVLRRALRHPEPVPERSKE